MRLIAQLLAALIAAALLAGCRERESGDTDARSSPTTTASTIAATGSTSHVSPTAEAPSPTATLTPTATSPVAEPYPGGARAGIPAVDAVLTALESPSPAALEALFALVPAPCKIRPQSITNPPLCPEGVAAGTPVPVFRATACESVWPEYLEEVLTGPFWKSPRPLLAVYRGPTEAYSWLPAADYAIIVHSSGTTPAGGWPTVVRVKDGRVNGIAFGCGETFDQLIEGVASARFVLPPRR